MGMLKLKTLTLQNFMSFGQVPQVFDLSEEASRLIVGDNRDIGTPGKSRNGCGKSVLFNGVLFGLYGAGVDKELKVDGFINFFNEKNLSVRLEIEVDGVDYAITRKRKPNEVKLERLSHDPEDLTKDSMANTDKSIEKLIGYSYDVFVMLFYLSPSKRSFMAMKGAEQRDMIEKILSLDVLVKRSETIKSMVKDAKVAHKILTRDLEHITGELTKYEQAKENLTSLLKQWDQDQKALIDGKVSSLSKFDGVDFDEELSKLKSYNEIRTEMDALVVEISQLGLDQSRRENGKHGLVLELNAVERKIRDTLALRDEAEASLKQANDDLAALPSKEEIESEINALREMDHNKQSLRRAEADISSIKMDIDRTTKDIELMVLANKDYENSMAETKEKIQRLVDYTEGKQVEVETQKYHKAESLYDAIGGIERDIHATRASVSAMNDKKNSLVETLNSLEMGECPTCGSTHVSDEKTQTLEMEIATLSKQIEDAENKVAGLYSEYDALSQEVRSLGHMDLGEIHELQRQYDQIKVLENSLLTNPPHSESSFKDKRDSLDSMGEKLAKLTVERDTLQKSVDMASETEYTIEDLEEALGAVNHAKYSIDSLSQKTFSVEEEVVQAETLRNDIAAVDKEIEKIVAEVDELTKKHMSLNDKSSQIKPLYMSEGEITNTRDFVEQIRKDVDVEKNRENPYKGQLDGLVKPDTSSVEQSLREIETRIEHGEYLARLLTDNKSFIRKGIVGQYLGYFNRKMLEYTTQLGLPHVAELNPDMSVEIVYMNRETTYYNMSAGERLRLNAAATAAFKDMIGMLGKGCNLLMVDEFVDGSLDPEGMYKSFNFLKDISQSLLLISHRQEFVTEVDSVVTVVKENGFSRIM